MNLMKDVCSSLCKKYSGISFYKVGDTDIKVVKNGDVVGTFYVNLIGFQFAIEKGRFEESFVIENIQNRLEKFMIDKNIIEEKIEYKEEDIEWL